MPYKVELTPQAEKDLSCLDKTVAENLAAEGVAPPVFVSGNRDGGEMHNLKLLQKYFNRIRF